jgi:hypothetical protein
VALVEQPIEQGGGHDVPPVLVPVSIILPA